MFIYKGSTALITGASKGLGVTFAEELARRGADLVLVARSKDALQTLAARLTAQYGVKCCVIAADLANPRTIDDIYAELAETGVPVDLLINNAGLGLSGRFLDHDHSKGAGQHSSQCTGAGWPQPSVRPGHVRTRSGRNHQYRVKLGLPAAAVHGDLCRVESFRPPFWRSAATRTVPCRSSGHDGLSWTDGDQFFRGHTDDNVRPIFRHARNGGSRDPSRLRSGKGRGLSWTAERTVRNLAATAVAPQPDCPSRGNGDQKDGVGVREGRFATRCGQRAPPGANGFLRRGTADTHELPDLK